MADPQLNTSSKHLITTTMDNKRLKIVYVLTSSPNDIYLEQAYVSMCSLKHYNPEAKVVILTDQLTAATFTGTRKRETRFADEIKVVDLSENLNGQRRSRLLKTSARKHIEGDFLFIDTDTIIAKPLDDILNVEADLAACYDTHCEDFKENPYYKDNVKKGLLLDMPQIVDEEHYFNTGVILVRDTELAHKFYDNWNANLLKGIEKKVFMDQPSFSKTNFEMGHVVKPLQDVWNVELKHGIRFLKDAKIVHYLCTNISKNKERQFFIMNDMEVLLNIKKNGEIPEDVKQTIEDPFKGISPVCHCFAGEDIYFFKTQLFKHTRSQFDSSLFPLMEWCVMRYNGLTERWNKLKRLIKRGKNN